MSKQSCGLCHNELSFLSRKTVFSDGVICNKCLKLGGTDPSFWMSKNTIEQARDFFTDERKNLVQNYRKTERYSKIDIDENSRLFELDKTIYRFADVVSYEYQVDNVKVLQPKVTHKKVKVVVKKQKGGLITGPIRNAFVDAFDNAYEDEDDTVYCTCRYLRIDLKMRIAVKPTICLNYLDETGKIPYDDYVEAEKKAQKDLEALRIIAGEPENQSNEKDKPVFLQKEHLTAEQFARELNVYETLMASGRITKEEFEQKKKQLLSMM